MWVGSPAAPRMRSSVCVAGSRTWLAGAAAASAGWGGRIVGGTPTPCYWISGRYAVDERVVVSELVGLVRLAPVRVRNRTTTPTATSAPSATRPLPIAVWSRGAARGVLSGVVVVFSLVEARGARPGGLDGASSVGDRVSVSRMTPGCLSDRPRVAASERGRSGGVVNEGLGYSVVLRQPVMAADPLERRARRCCEIANAPPTPTSASPRPPPAPIPASPQSKRPS